MASAAIVIHLLCVAVVLAANVAPSPLQRRLVAIVAPYTRTLWWDPNFAPFHWTHGDADHDDQRIVSRELEGSARRIARGARGTLRHARHQTLASFAAYHATREIDEVVAVVIRRLAIPLLSDRNARVLIEIEAADPLSLDDAPSQYDTPTRRESIYAADVWLDASGTARLLKQVPLGEAAVPRSPGGER